MNTLWYWLVIPLMYILITKIIFPKEINIKEMAIQALLCLSLPCLFYGCTYYSETSDSLVINGKVTEKVRDNDSHLESYSCHCRTTRVGKTTSTHCDTCWRTVYTVDWFLRSTIGNISLDSERSYSSSVWNRPDPANYVEAIVGEHCAKSEGYANYVRASSLSLFNTMRYKVSPTMTLPVPTYPSVYGTYKTQSVLNVNTKVDVKEWNKTLHERLKELGNSKQLDMVIIFVNTNDTSYRYKVEKEWYGGKKNSLVVIIGTTDNKTASWVDSFTFGLSSGNMLLLTQINDAIKGRDINPQTTVDVISNFAAAQYKRKEMKDFEYLLKEIQPSSISMMILGMFQLILCLGGTLFNVKNEL